MALKKKNDGPTLTQEWKLPPAATLGSSVRAKGILLEVRAKLLQRTKKAVDIKGAVITLITQEDQVDEFRSLSTLVAKVLVGIEHLPVIPREIEDILSISTTERHRWLKDGRLQSAGTRTVKLRGRAKKITFHVFDPRHVEDILDRDLVSGWREDDTQRATENRRRAVEQRRLTRTLATAPKATPEDNTDDLRPQLKGWEEFERNGPL